MSDFDQWISEVSRWRDATANIPLLVREDIQKGKYKPQPPTGGFRSYFDDPLAIQYSMGYKDRKYSLTYDVLKQVVQNLSLLSSIINTRVNQISSFAVPFRISKSLGYVVKHKDPGKLTTKGEREMIKDLERFIYNCGSDKPNPHTPHLKRDDFETFLKKIVRDSLTYDQVCAEIVPARNGTPYEFVAVDASTIRIWQDKNEFLEGDHWQKRKIPDLHPASRQNPFSTMQSFDTGELPPAYVQVINGQLRTAYNREQLAFGVRNPRTDIYQNGYGYSEIEQLITIITSHLYAEEYNRRFFMQGSAPKGMIVFKGDAMDTTQLEGFRREWRANVEGTANCLAGNTRIYTAEFGFVSLEDICGNAPETPVHLWTGTSWESGLVYKTEPKELCHTKLDNGLVVSSSPDHKFRVIGETGDPVWKTQAELKTGDVALVNKKDPALGTQLMCLGQEVTPDFMEVLGWFLGDGSVHYRTNDRGHRAGATLTWFYNAEKELDIRDRHLKVLQQYFPQARSHTHARSDEEIQRIKNKYGFKSVQRTVETIQLQNVTALTWFEKHGFVAEKRKSIPAQLFLMPETHRNSYLRGLFSADGNNARCRTPELTCSADNIRTQVRHLLLASGIRTALSEGTTTRNPSTGVVTRHGHKLSVKDRDVFFSLVGFVQDHKQPKTLRKLAESNKHDFVPRSTLQKYLLQVREANKAAGYTLLTRRQRMDLNSIIAGIDGCSKTRLVRYLKTSGVDVPAWLEDFHTARVVETTATGVFVPMFDVSVDHPDHMFVGENVLISNSWKTPIFQSEQGVDWIAMATSNRDMEYGQWLEYLIKITTGVFLIDPAELNFDLAGGVQQTPLFESSSEWKLKASRDRGLKPLLRFFAKFINDNIIAKIDDHFTFDFVGLDELTEQEKHELRKEQVASYMTLNEIRRAEDLPDVDGGDMILNPTYIQALQVRQQLEATEQAQAGGQGGQAPQQGQKQSGMGEDEDQDKNNPQYADQFTKALKSTDKQVPVLEIDIDDSWINLLQ